MNRGVGNWSLIFAGVSAVFGWYLLIPVFLVLSYLFYSSQRGEDEAKRALSAAVHSENVEDFVEAAATYWGMFFWAVFGFLLLLVLFGGGMYMFATPIR